MDKSRVTEILKNKEIKDIFYNENPVWIQEVHGNKARVGFLNSFDYKDVYIENLYEKNLYNKN